MSRIIILAALGLFAALVMIFAYMLTRDDDPNAIPSALIGKPLAPFDLPPVAGRAKAMAPDGLALDDLTQGRVSVVNVFASWCPTCRQEAPSIKALSQRKDITLFGIAWKDEPAKTAAFLQELGDPFAKVGNDQSGRTAIDWGVYGVPETFVIDGHGRVVARYAGALSPQTVAKVITPAIAAAKAP